MKYIITYTTNYHIFDTIFSISSSEADHTFVNADGSRLQMIGLLMMKLDLSVSYSR